MKVTKNDLLVLLVLKSRYDVTATESTEKRNQRKMSREREGGDYQIRGVFTAGRRIYGGFSIVYMGNYVWLELMRYSRALPLFLHLLLLLSLHSLSSSL